MRGLRTPRLLASTRLVVALAASLVLALGAGCDEGSLTPLMPQGVGDGFGGGPDVTFTETDNGPLDTAVAPQPVPQWAKDLASDPVPQLVTAWLRDGRYEDWAASPGIHPSAEGMSRVFLNQPLAAALADGGEHPLGAMAVRELYAIDGSLAAVNLTWKRTSGSSVPGEDWLFVEVTDFQGGAGPSVFEPAAPGCMACHAGKEDVIISAWPLK